MSCVLRWCHHAGQGVLELLPVASRKGQEQLCLSEKSQSPLARLCAENESCPSEKPICHCIPNREELWPAHSMIDELLGQGSMDKILKQPGKGEHRELKLDKKSQNQPGEHSQGCWEGLQR